MNNTPLEEAEQLAYIQWLDLKKITYFAIPNVVKLLVYLKTKIQRINFWKQREKEGVKKGVPDLVVFLPCCILFVEMKRIEGSRTSIEQKLWNVKLNDYEYCRAVIAMGCDAAIRETKRLLGE